MRIDGKTRVYGLLGQPVGHTLSCAMHNAAFSALDLNCVYLPFDVPPGELDQALGGVRALNMGGVNLTVPHKEASVSLVDEIASGAAVMGAVNTVVNREGVLYGYNTDGDGFIHALRQKAGFDPGGKTVLITGAGGAARAVAISLALAGAKQIFLTNRTTARAENIASTVTGLQSHAQVIPRSDAKDMEKAAGYADLVVQATSLGMYPDTGEGPEFPFHALKAGVLATDLVYSPPYTAFLHRARESGARVLCGGWMLLYQGALAFSLFTGLAAPFSIMQEALANLGFID